MWRNGFTLVELLVLLTVIALLTALLLPMSIHANEMRHKSRCLQNQKDLTCIIESYAGCNEEGLPGTRPAVASNTWMASNIPMVNQQSWRNDLVSPHGHVLVFVHKQPIQPYIKCYRAPTAAFFVCPSGKLTGAPGAQADYGYNATLLGAQLGEIRYPDLTLEIADTSGHDIICSPAEIARRHEGGYIVGFADGRCEFIKEVPPDPPALNLALPSIALTGANKTAMIISNHVLTVTPYGAEISGAPRLLAGSYLTIYASYPMPRATDILHIHHASSMTSICLPAGIAAGDMYVVKLPPPGTAAAWELSGNNVGPATLTPLAVFPSLPHPPPSHPTSE